MVGLCWYGWVGKLLLGVFLLLGGLGESLDGVSGAESVRVRMLLAVG